MPTSPFTFALEFSSQGASGPLLEELAGQVFRHVGCPADADRRTGAALTAATAGGTFGGASRCDIQFRAHNHTLEILVSANGGRIWQTSCAIPYVNHTMRLYNTLTRSEEPFAPGTDNTVRMYTCGLTVYARGHIGNFRTFVCVDVLRRTLRHLLGYSVHHVLNFTDVDDRTILGAQKANMDLRAYTDQYIAAFREDARALGLEQVEENPARHRPGEHRRDGDDGRATGAERAHLPQRRFDLLQDLLDAGLRQARAPRSCRHEAGRAGRCRRLRERRCARLRAVEGNQAGRADLGSGRPPGGPAGTSSAPPWRCGSSASRRSTFTPAASI